MLKTFDLQTERFVGDDYQENTYAKIFSIPRSILFANNYSDDIHLVFSVYWLSNYHYSRCGTYSLTVRQGLDGCLLGYLGHKGTTYLENGVCYKVTDTDIEIYVRPSASNYATRIVIEGNSKFYLFCKSSFILFKTSKSVEEFKQKAAEIINNFHKTRIS